jgi:uncharacterized membrane protein
VPTPPDQPQPGPLSGARTAALAASIVVLLAVVSLAARSGDHDRAVPGGAAAGTAGHHALTWVLLVLGPIVAVVGLGLFFYAQVMRRRDDPQMVEIRRRSRLRRNIALLVVAALIGYSWLTGQNPVAVLTGLLQDIFGNVHVNGFLPFTGHEPPGQRHHAQGHSGGVGGIDWGIAAATWLLLIVALAITVPRLRRRMRADAAARTAPDAEERPEDLGLERLRAEPDPRRAVIGAYALMDRVMADRALGRRRSEAPLEYLGRMTAAGYARITNLGRLTGLYARARFSTHPIDRRMQAEAIDAVEAIATEEPE